MKNKTLIITNSILLLIALYTFIAIHLPSILNFSNKTDYVSKGGDHLTDGLFVYLFHYCVLIIFYLLNVSIIIKSLNKRKSNLVIAIISTLIMISFHFIGNSKIDENTIQVEALE